MYTAEKRMNTRPMQGCSGKREPKKGFLFYFPDQLEKKEGKGERIALLSLMGEMR